MDDALSPIPKPEYLDAGRIKTDDREDMTIDDHRSRAALLAAALEDSCAYAEQLWETLDDTRRYLYTSLPPLPDQDPEHAYSGAAPTGPDDEEGWRGWVNTFANVASTLAGPHGDSGFGFSTARDAERLRRAGAGPRRLGPVPLPEPAAVPRPSLPALPRSRESVLRAGALATLVALALRGLRPNPGSRSRDQAARSGNG